VERHEADSYEINGSTPRPSQENTGAEAAAKDIDLAAVRRRAVAPPGLWHGRTFDPRPGRRVENIDAVGVRVGGGAAADAVNELA